MRNVVGHGRWCARPGCLDEDKAGAVVVDATFEPCAVVADEKFHGEGVEEFVGEEDAGERGEFGFVGHVRHLIGPSGESFFLEGAPVGQRFDDDDVR